MKKKAAFLLSYLCLLSLFCIGAAELLLVDKSERVSESEKRLLQGFPALSAESVLSGRFMGEFETFLSDGFFFREESSDFNARLLGLFALPDDGPETGVVAEDRLWEETGEEQEPFSDETTDEGMPALADTQAALPTEAPENAALAPEETSAAQPLRTAEHDGSLWLTTADGGREVLFTYPAASLTNMADILNRFRAELGADGQVFFLNPQVSEVYRNIVKKDRYVGWGSDVADLMQPLADEGVTILDACELLTPYIGQENLYPMADYHWHPISASLTVDALMSLQGFPAVDYGQYRYHLSTMPYNKAVTRETLSGMRYGRDVIEIMEPITPAHSYFLDHLTNRRDGFFIKFPAGYDAYLGGHFGPWRLIETGFHTGRTALFVGDCFTPPMMTYIAPYYDQIISTDVRRLFYSQKDAGGSIADYMAAYGVDDVYIVYSTNSMVWDNDLQTKLRTYLYE